MSDGNQKVGGTLRLAGNGDVDHLDTASANNVVTLGLLRVYTRQLVTYPTTSDVRLAATIVADLAEEVPTLANGGISADGLTYTLRIREGACWDAPAGPRQITAADMVLGIKRLFNPVARTPSPHYFTDTIVGLAAFAQEFAEVPADVQSIKSYVDSTDLAGVRAVDERTVEFNLIRPAIDFLNVLALVAASPAPREYLDYLPDGPEFRQNTISCGPYRISTYLPGKRIQFDRNPAWRQDSDPVRHAYVDEVVVEEGLTQEEAYQQVETGAADLLWDSPPSPGQLSALRDSGDPRFHLYPRDILEPYLVFNLASPNEGRATSNVLVRRAIAYGIDKVAVSAYWAAILTPTDQIIPAISPAAQDTVQYPTPGHRGDPDRAKELLAEAGYPDGLVLKLVVQNVTSRLTSAGALRDSLARAGITVELVPMPTADFWGFLEHADNARTGGWDLVLPGWAPDWIGTNTRSYMAPLFDGAPYTADSATFGHNYGFYHNPRVSELIAAANRTTDLAESHLHYTAAAEQIMRDAAVVPIAFMNGFIFCSHRLRGVEGYPVVHANIPEVWIDE